ncbi:MAG: SusC/RagA family TonB-linked outer membrane protein [Sphingobacterium hotanense]
MMMRTKFLPPIFAFLFSIFFQLNAQQLSIRGIVRDSETMESIANVTIISGKNSSQSDQSGNFNIDAPKGSKLKFTSLGYRSSEIVVDSSFVEVLLIRDFADIDEVVVVGYGTVKRSDLTGSVTRVNSETFKNQPMTQFTDMLSGTVAGFSSKQSTGAAGKGSMQIRGPNSIQAGSSPMIVLDGVIFNGSIEDINPNDIKTIDILKDASSAAVYGSRAASGVVLITTEKGHSGEPSINISSSVGVSQLLNPGYFARDPQNYLNMRRDFFRSRESNKLPDYHWLSPSELPAGVSIEDWRKTVNNPDPDDEKEWLRRLSFFPTEIEGYKNNQTVNWVDEGFRTGLRQDYNIGISAGSEKSKQYFSLGYVNNQGILLGDKYKAIRGRVNLDFDLSSWLKIGTNLQFSRQDESSVPATLDRIQIMSPYASLYDDKGKLNWYPHGYLGGPTNPLLDHYGQEKEYITYNLFGSVFAEIALPFGIQYKASFQPLIETYRDYNYWSPETQKGGHTFSNGYATRDDFTLSEWMIDNLLKWNKEIGIHNFDVTLLYSAEERNTWLSQATNQNFLPSPILGFGGIQFGDKPAISANDEKRTGDAFMARLNYSLLKKYLLTLSIRRDGYSAFGQENPKASFPAAAFAWQIHNEEFFKVKSVNELKLRLSWGVNGNRDIGVYSALDQIGSNPYYNGSGTQQGVVTSTLPNAALRWEETEALNLGLDLSMFDYRLNLTADVYQMKTSNLLVNRSLPTITGFEDVMTNIGQLDNKGLELSLSTKNIRRENFDWTSSLNFSLNRNKIKTLFGDQGKYILEGKEYYGELPEYGNKWFPGKSLDAIWDYSILGVWQKDEAAEALKYTLYPGDYKAEDLDGNGKYEALQDKKFIGYTEPRFNIGLRNEVNFLRNFSASVFIRADLGHKRHFNPSLVDVTSLDRLSTANFPYWSPDNPTNDWPRLGFRRTAYGGGIMPYKPTSFLRVQDVSLAYNVGKEYLQALKFTSLRAFVSARNLFTFDKWPGADPESGFAPMPRTFSVGLNIVL